MNIEEIVNEQFDTCWRNLIVKKKRNRLFEIIKERYLKQTEQTDESLDDEQACDMLWEWYINRCR